MISTDDLNDDLNDVAKSRFLEKIHTICVEEFKSKKPLKDYTDKQRSEALSRWFCNEVLDISSDRIDDIVAIDGGGDYGVDFFHVFDYTILRVKHANKKYINLDAGIDINPKAMEFFKKYNTVLKKAVNLEWARFLEKLNLGVPRLIQKTEGEIIPRTALGKYRKALEPYFKNCYYCNNPLQKNETHVEHVIPFDYIAEDNIWNFTLACQKCNCTKLGSLPPEKFLDELISRNKNYRSKISMIDKSLTLLGVNYEKIIRDHFENAKSHGYVVLKDFPN